MKAIAGLLLCLAIQVHAQVILIPIPIAPNSPAATNGVFWLSNPPPTSIQQWQLTQLLQTNFNLIQVALNGLSNLTDGSVLTNLQGSNVVGKLALAVLPNSVATNGGTIITSYLGVGGSPDTGYGKLHILGGNLVLNSTYGVTFDYGGGAGERIVGTGTSLQFQAGGTAAMNFNRSDAGQPTAQIAMPSWVAKATTERVSFRSEASTHTIGTNSVLSNWRNNQFLAQTLNNSSDGPASIINATTVYIDDQPKGSASIANPMALWVKNGNVVFGGTLIITNGLVLPQLTRIPTNSIPAITSGATNWVLLNLTNTINGGGPMYCATNPAVVGGFQFLKPTYTATTWP